MSHHRLLQPSVALRIAAGGALLVASGALLRGGPAPEVPDSAVERLAVAPAQEPTPEPAPASKPAPAPHVAPAPAPEIVIAPSQAPARGAPTLSSPPPDRPLDHLPPPPVNPGDERPANAASPRADGHVIPAPLAPSLEPAPAPPGDEPAIASLEPDPLDEIEEIAPDPEPGPAARTLAFFSFVLNQVEHDPIPIYLTEGDALVAVSDLEASGLRVDGGDRFALRGEYVSLASLAHQLDFELDKRDLKLVADADPTYLSRSTLSLARDSRPEDMRYTRDASAFVNYGVRLLDGESLYGYGEAGVHVRSAQLYTGLTVGADGEPARGLSNMTFEQPASLRRIVVGDAFANGGVLGGGAFLGGMQISRTSELDPYFTPGPSLDHSATIIVPSTLEVYVNDQLTHREEVAPGPIEIQDIPATVGAGDTRVVLRDALGREQTLTASYYNPAGLLPEGEQEYTYSVGLQRAGVGTDSWDYGTLGFMGLHKIGLRPALTATGRVEGAADRLSAGATAITGGGLGELEAAAGTSVVADWSAISAALGAAGSLTWSYTGHRLGASIWGRYMSDRYGALGLDPEDDRATGDAGSSLSVPVSRRVTVSSSYALAAMRDAGLRQRASVNSGVQLPEQLHLGLTGSWSRGVEDDSQEINLFASLSRALGKRTAATLREEVTGDSQLSRAELQRTLPTGAGVGFRAGGTLPTGELAGEGTGGTISDDGALYGRVDAQSAVGVANARYDWSQTEDSSLVGVAGGVIAIGGRLFASRPVEQGYALVRVPGVRGVRAYLNNNEVGRTNRRGDLIVTGLLPYYGNRLGIADLDVPLDHAIASTEQVVAPPTRGGALVTFPVHRLRLVRGRLRVPGGDPAYGEIRVVIDGWVITSPIGHGGEFELEGVPEGEWTADVAFAGGICSLRLAVPPSPKAIVDVGTLTCQPPLTQDAR